MNLENKVEEELHKMTGEIFRNNTTYQMLSYDMAEKLCKDYQDMVVNYYKKLNDYDKQEIYDKAKNMYDDINLTNNKETTNCMQYLYDSLKVEKR